MRVERKAVLFCFSVKSGRFESTSERNKFFKELYGWKQIVSRENKVYKYWREGILDDVPHQKVDQSSFIVPEENFEKVADFLKEWHDKVIWKTFRVLLENFEAFFKNGIDEVE